MTRRDFVMLSKALNAMHQTLDQHGTLEERRGCRCAVFAIADAIEDDCPVFDRERFIRDCGIDPNLMHH